MLSAEVPEDVARQLRILNTSWAHGSDTVASRRRCGGLDSCNVTHAPPPPFMNRRNQMIVALHAHGYSYAAIARAVGCSGHRIRQICDGAYSIHPFSGRDYRARLLANTERCLLQVVRRMAWYGEPSLARMVSESFHIPPETNPA